MDNTNKLVYLTRQMEFAAAHRLYKDELTPEENLAVYGKCANPHGHGHNYILEVTFKGYPDARTEIVVHYQEMKKLLEELIVKPADHRNLNHDVPFMKGQLTCTENIAVAVWETLAPALAGKTWQLHKVKIASTPRNWVEYYGETK